MSPPFSLTDTWFVTVKAGLGLNSTSMGTLPATHIKINEKPCKLFGSLESQDTVTLRWT